MHLPPNKVLWRVFFYTQEPKLLTVLPLLMHPLSPAAFEVPLRAAYRPTDSVVNDSTYLRVFLSVCRVVRTVGSVRI